MPITTGVPSTLRRPATFHRFIYQSGGRALTPLPQRTVLIGTMKGGSGVASTIYTLADPQQTDALFGIGTSLALMCRKAFEMQALLGVGPFLFACPVAENAAGVARTQTFTLTGTATVSDNLIIRIAGRTIAVPVSVGDTAAVVAGALNVAVNAQTKVLPGTSTVAAAVATFTAAHKGVWGADIAFSVDNIPSGLTCVTAQGVAGSGAMDETLALAAVAGSDYDTIALENHNTTAVALGLAHVTQSWAPTEKKWRWLVYGEPGTIGSATTLASAANDKAMLFPNFEACPNLPGEIATTVACAVTSKTRPNANWDNMQLPLYPPPEAFVFTNTEIETALAAGVLPLTAVISPSTRAIQQNVSAIVKMVTSSTTIDGQPSELLRDLAVSRASAFMARQLDSKYAERFGASANPDGVLLDDDAIARVRDMVAAVNFAAQDGKILKNVETDIGKLVVEIDPNTTGRLNVENAYTVVLGLHQVPFVHRVIVGG